MSLDNWERVQGSAVPVWKHTDQLVVVAVGPQTEVYDVEVGVFATMDSDTPIKTRKIDERGAATEADAVENAEHFLEAGGPREVDEPRVQHLVEAGLSRSEAVDWWMTEERGMSQAKWAEKCGCTQQAISDSVSRARKKLDGH